MLSSIYVKLGLGLAVAIAVFVAVQAVRAAVDKIAAQGREIASLQISLAAEKKDRQRDVSALTTLSQGVVAASSARAIDDKILAETIDAKNPQPSSPGLAHFLDGLRASDNGGKPAPAKASAGAGPAPGGGAVRPAHR